jgi:hypothetical protein
MAADELTEAQIRGQIARERQQLVLAVGGLRQGLEAKRRTAVAVAVAVPVAIAGAVIARRLWRG